MPDGTVSPDAFGECAREGCHEPCPWDMAAVVFDAETVCCSPACARKVLKRLEQPPSVVTYHDPQGNRDHEALGVDRDHVDVIRDVRSFATARHVIGNIEELHQAPFRLEGGDD